MCGEPAVLAFVKRKLVGVLALSIRDSRITKIHALVQSSVLASLRMELSAAR